MITTTSYGTWVNHGDKYALTVEATVMERVSGADSEWLERVQASRAFDRIVSDYRQAINDALPTSVTLAGDDFIGPHDPADCDWDGELDIAAIIESVDLDAIVDRHDPDRA